MKFARSDSYSKYPRVYSNQLEYQVKYSVT